MKESLVEFETAKLAKERGFNNWFSDYSEKNHHLKGWRDRDEYLDEVELPKEIILSLLQKWLREVHKIDVIPYPSFMGKEGNYYYVIIKDRDFDNIIQQPTLNMSHDDCLEDGLLEALRLIN
jgi:hypothetical protein